MSKKNVNNKCPKKCINCEYRKVITHSVVPYNFCTKLNVSFCGGEPKEFLNCGRWNYCFFSVKYGGKIYGRDY